MHLTLSRKQLLLFPAITAVAFFLLGHFITLLHDPGNTRGHYLNTAHPYDLHYIEFKLTEVLKPTPYAYRYVAQVTKLDGEAARGKILINQPIDSSNILKPAVDDLMAATLYLKKIDAPRNPHQFNYRKYLEQQGIFAQAILDGSSQIKKTGTSPSLRGMASRVRDHLSHGLAKYDWPQEDWAVVNALLLGQRQEISRELTDRYAAAGMVHILAISGLHVGILMLILQVVLSALGNYKVMRIIKAVIIITMIWCFAFIAGLTPSILRAAVMFTLIQIGITMGRKNAGLNALLISAFLLLLIDPLLLYQVGFQLSYLAVLFILLLQPVFMSLYDNENYTPNRWYSIPKKLYETAAVTISAQLGVLPLSIYYFHQFPVLFLLSNLVVIPFLGIILGTGMVLLIITAMGVSFPAFAEAYAAIIHALNVFISWIAGFNDLVIQDIHLSPQLLFASYLAIVALVILLRRPRARNLMLFQVGLLLFMGMLYWQKESKVASRFYILQRSSKTLLAQKQDRALTVFTDDTISLRDNTIKPFLESTQINTIVKKRVMGFYRFGESQILVIDSLGVYEINDIQPRYILLKDSPQININRLLNRFPDITIIADGSNYRSYVARWKETCSKRKIPFHSTYEKGFYEIH
tara:strand:+ start:1244 stop:3151 length:1908 start_codon:yes stop_codon:yes gene_type:complete